MCIFLRIPFFPIAIGTDGDIFAYVALEKSISFSRIRSEGWGKKGGIYRQSQSWVGL